MIDRWNGRIQKENVKLKKTSLEWLTRWLMGVPCTVVQGYVKKLQVDIPWSELQSRPIEVTIEDLHVVLTSSEFYKRDFVKDALLDIKKSKVEELCKMIEVRTRQDYRLLFHHRDGNLKISLPLYFIGKTER